MSDPSAPSVSSVASVVPAKLPLSAVLNTAQTALFKLRQANDTLAMEFMTRALPNCLKIGLHCLRAYEVFVHNPGKGGNKSGRNQHSRGTVRADGSSPTGFEGWLKADVPWLKKTNAYRYMTALKGLGLNGLATEEEVDDALAQHSRVGPVTLKLLCDQSLDPVSPSDAPPPLQQSEFEFIRDGLAAFRVEGDALLALKPQLLANPDLHRAACARAYQILSDLTGTNWAPSDQPDTLATIDPDAISL